MLRESQYLDPNHTSKVFVEAEFLEALAHCE